MGDRISDLVAPKDGQEKLGTPGDFEDAVGHMPEESPPNTGGSTAPKTLR